MALGAGEPDEGAESADSATLPPADEDTGERGTPLPMGTAITGLDSEARRLLYEHPWPGNVRELENTIERAMVLGEGDKLMPADLPERIREAQNPVQMQLTSGELSVKKTTRIIEEILIRRALQKTKGNRTRAAEVLEISHRALLYKIKDYKITDL